MARINEMRMPTWATLGLNYIKDESINLIENTEISNSEAEQIEEVEMAFKPYKIGLSEEINKENVEFRNYTLNYDIKEDNKTEYINLDLNKDKDILVSAIDINAHENTNSSFLVSIYDDSSMEKFFLNSQIRVRLAKGARVKLVVVTNMSQTATNLNSIATFLEDDAFLDINYIELGAGKSLVNNTNILKGDRSKVSQKGVYFKADDDFLDLLATNIHYGNETDSDALFNGALRDRAEKNFKGIVDLKRGCLEADGKIGDYSMMLSDEVINKTAPILLNEEKYVSGNHAASVGRLNKEMLFYIMSRGFSKKVAESMMLEANFTPALDKIEDEKLREKLKAKVHEMNTRE